MRYAALLSTLCLVVSACVSDESDLLPRLANEYWDIAYDDRGIRALTSPQDIHRANVLPESGMLDADVRFELAEGEWQTVFKRFSEFYRPPEHERSYARQHNVEDDRVRYTDYKPGMPFALEQTFTLNGERLEWDLVVENRMGYEVNVGDIFIEFPSRPATGSTQEGLFEGGFLRQHYVSGASSFLLFIRRSGAPPYLLLTVKPGTGFEYFQGSQYFIRSGYSGNAETRGTWRQAHTYDRLAPAGTDGDRLEFGLELQWAESYDELRRFLVENGLIDVRVVPGMTVPKDLEARFSLHTAATIDSITAEFPDETEVSYMGETQPDHHVYGVRFGRLGENMLTVHFDGHRKTYLEFFSTETIATLIEKRSHFIVNNQQHRDPKLWYDGLFSIWDMRNAVLRGPDNTDGYDGWWGYMVACDDPVLGIAPYLASVNALDPNPAQIEALEYHIERFVWDGLQRTDQDDPYPYGIYGVPNWRVARDTLLRAQIENRRLDRMKIWRAYDYPHVFMLYYHMYQIADRFPGLVSFRDADGYLELAWQTARAFFEYPYEVYPWYDIYKWGFYNELLVPEIMEVLEERGRREEADSLRRQWETKVRYFVHDDPYPYRSEYPTDRTAFESTYALARYAAATELEAVDSLWYDINIGIWRSYPLLTRDDALAFMEDQHYAGLAVRGWLSAKYYQLGADGSMSYMARMGGWSVLNYGLEFASDPHDWLQLGYASYLSSFALMNTGPPEANHGFWYPGPENDGALGWAFQTSKHGRPWIRQSEDRGPWRYDGEGNLGMGAVTRTAATILTEDPIFGWLAYGGILNRTAEGFEVHPRDGVRIRFWLVDGDHRLGLELERDGWSPEMPVRVDDDLARLRLVVQNRTGTQHVNRLFLRTPNGVEWKVSFDGEELTPEQRGERQVYRLNVMLPEHELTLERR